MAAAYDAEGADELIFLDITASSGDRETTYDVVRRTAEQVFIPLTVGGGVRSVGRRRPAAAGRRRQGVGVNTAAIARPELIGEIAERFGCAGAGAVASTPAALRRAHRVRLRGHHARRARGAPASTRSEWAARGAELGAGEILLNSMDADGTKDGYDLRADRGGPRAWCDVPVIATGGAGQLRRTSRRPSRRAPTRCWPPASSTSASCGSARSRTRCARPGLPGPLGPPAGGPVRRSR